MSIFTYSDIDTVLIVHCDLIDDYPTIRSLNKYYNTLIDNTINYQSLIQLVHANSNYKDLFIKACEYNSPLYRYLFNRNPNLYRESRYGLNMVPISFNLDFAFSICCKNGHLEAAKLLLELRKTHCKQQTSQCIHYWHEEPFRTCCENGHLHVAKWLIKTSITDDLGLIDIHVANSPMLNNYAFIWSCIRGHKHVAKWLIKLSHKYHYTPINVDDYKGKIIHMCPIDKRGDVIKLLDDL